MIDYKTLVEQLEAGLAKAQAAAKQAEVTLHRQQGALLLAKSLQAEQAAEAAGPAPAPLTIEAGVETSASSVESSLTENKPAPTEDGGAV